MYLPTCANECIENVHDAFNKIIDKIVQSKGLLRKKSNPLPKRNLMIDLASCIDEDAVKEAKETNYEIDTKFNRKSQLEQVVNTMTGMLEEVSNRNNIAFENLQTCLNENIPNDFYQYNPDDILTDHRINSETLNHFKEYIIKKYLDSAESNSKIFSSRIEEENNCNPDDIVCLVCNNGDYEDDDLIVYCSTCQMTVHQRCYGIVEIPQEDWICETCLAFGEKSKEIECILCPVTGGALKPCSIKKNSSFYSAIINLRKKNKNENLINFNFGEPLNIVKNEQEFELDGKLGSNIVKIDLDEDICSKEDSNKIPTEKSESQKKEDEMVIDDGERLCIDQSLFEVNGNEILGNNIETNIKIVKMDIEEETNDIRTNIDNNDSKDDKKDLSGKTTDVPKSEVKLKRTFFSVEVAPFNADNVSNLDTNKHSVKSCQHKSKGRQKKEKKKEEPKKEGKIKYNPVNTFAILMKQAIENAWVHLSCACWIPDVLINNYEKKEDIKSNFNLTQISRLLINSDLMKYVGYVQRMALDRLLSVITVI
jgi:hypothetical protein